MFEYITDEFGLSKLGVEFSASDKNIVSLDTETTALRPKDGRLRLIQLRLNGNTYVIDVDAFQLGRLSEFFRPIFENTNNKFVVQNCKFELAWLSTKLGTYPSTIFDTYLASKLLDFEAKGSLAAIAKRYLDIDLDKTEQASDWSGELTQSQLEYASLDVLHLGSLRELMLKDLVRTSQIEALKFEVGCVPAIVSMELAGMPLDYRKLSALVDKNIATKEEKAKELLNFLVTRNGTRDVPKKFVQDCLFEDEATTLEDSNAINIDSWQQVLPLYREMGIPIQSTDQKYITPMIEAFPEIRYLTEYRKYAKLASTYGSDLLSKIVDNRIYSDYQQIGTITMRMASRNINLQNIPRTKDYRACFSPQEGRKLIVCLHGDVLVETNIGKVKIKDIIPGHHKVLQPKGEYAEVSNHWSNGYREVYKLVTDMGTVDATFNHMFMWSDGISQQWKKVYQLSNGDHIVMPLPSGSKVLARVIDKFPIGRHEVFDITVPETSQFIANGFLTHNCDYAGFELRVLAEFSKDKLMLEAFETGKDLHSLTCANLFGLTYEEVEKGKKTTYESMRVSAKVTNFSVAYGISPDALSDRIKSYGVDTNSEQAKQFIDGWYKSYPEAARWLFWREKEILKNPEMRSPVGHRMLFKFDPKEGRQVGMAKRASRNFLIQNCASFDTKILVKDKGLVSIGDMEGVGPITVWDGSRWVLTDGVVRSGQQLVYQINLKNGARLKFTNDHKLLTMDTHSKERWMSVGELSALKQMYLKLSDEVVYPNNIDVRKIIDSIIIEGTPINNYSFSDIKDNFVLGEILGRLASDGQLANRTVMFLGAQHERDVMLYLQKQLSVFGEKALSVINLPRVKNGKQEVYSINICSSKLMQQAIALGVKTKIPDICWLNREVMRGYLRGFFDGDGSVNSEVASVVWGGDVDKKEQWARDMQIALLSFGIRSRFAKYKYEKVTNGNRLRLNILKKFTSKFAKEIGFINNKKQAKVEAIKSSHKWKTYEIGHVYGHCERVGSIKPLQLEPVYDIINSETGRFMADGFVVHNCNAVTTKLAMMNIHKDLQSYRNAYMVNAVHDEIVAECDEKDAPEVAKIVQDRMLESAYTYLKHVKIEAEAGICSSWAEK